MTTIRTLGIALILASVVALLAATAPAPNPMEAARLNNIGIAYMNQQLFEKALKSFEAAAIADPALEVAAVNRGVALLNLQHGDEAKGMLEKATKSNPKDAHAWYSLGLYYKNSSNAGLAVDAFRRVTEIDPNDADTWYFLGSTCAQLKQFPEAIAAFEHALKLDPHHASAEFGLARAYQQSGQADPAHEAMKKFQYITQNKLGAPISLSYGEQGKYSRAEDSPVAVEKVPVAIPVRFVDVTESAGIITRPSPIGSATMEGGHVERHLAEGIVGTGACFLDYDGDGRVDVFVADDGPQGGFGLYHNLGNGKFEDVTKAAGLDPTLHGIGCTAGDYDNDGATDLVVSFRHRVMLLHNEKNGTFKDVTEAAGIKADGLNIGVTFIDYDHDGDLDLYITRASFRALAGGEAEWEDQMWRNNGNGTFTDVSRETGLATAGFHTAAVGTDYNNDRAVDLVVTDNVPTIFENPREGKFPARQPWTGSKPEFALGVAVLDFDHDGWMDLVFTHQGEPGITLWRNNQGKTFEQVPLPKVEWARAYGVVAFDYDNDGWVDLAAVGETKDGRGEVRLFRNLGPDGWKDVTAETGLDKIQLRESRAIIAGDYDNDGAVDLLITQNHGPAVLLHNEGGNKNNSLRLALKGLNARGHRR